VRRVVVEAAFSPRADLTFASGRGVLHARASTVAHSSGECASSWGLLAGLGRSIGAEAAGLARLQRRSGHEQSLEGLNPSRNRSGTASRLPTASIEFALITAAFEFPIHRPGLSVLRPASLLGICGLQRFYSAQKPVQRSAVVAFTLAGCGIVQAG